MRWRRPSRKARSQNVSVQRLLRVEDAPDIDGKDWKFEVRGLVDNKKSWTLEELYRLPRSAGHRHICVEGWSASELDGTPLRRFPQNSRATRARILLVPVRDPTATTHRSTWSALHRRPR